MASNTAPLPVFHGKIWVDTSVTPNVTKWYNSTAGAWQTTPVKGAVPFIVKTTAEVVDGYTVPPGVYIDSAYISRLTANQIDTRGLSIRDATGNVIFSAGTPLDWQRVGGDGKPQDGATVGAQIGVNLTGQFTKETAGSAFADKSIPGVKIGTVMSSDDWDGAASSDGTIITPGTRGWVMAKGNGTPGTSKLEVDAAHIRGTLNVNQLNIDDYKSSSGSQLEYIYSAGTAVTNTNG